MKKKPKYANGMQGAKIPKLPNSNGGSNTNANIAAGAGIIATGASLFSPQEADSEVPEGGSAAGIVSSAASGAAAGAAFGPWGAVIGAGIGTGIGAVQYGQADKAHAAGLRRRDAKLRAFNQSNTTRDTSSMEQTSQYKKGSKRIATKEIEIEAKEPVFSKPINGKRQLKQYSHNGPTHEEGGIPVLAEEGDAVITAKDNLGPKAVLAHQQGDHATVEKIIESMPEDNSNKKAKGGKRKIMPASSFKEFGTTFPNNPQRAAAYKSGIASGKAFEIADGNNIYKYGPTPQPKGIAALSPSSGALSSNLSEQAGSLPTKLNTLPVTASATTTPTTNRQRAARADGNDNALAGIGEAAPTLYNLSQGLFGSVDKTTRRNYNPDLLNYNDLSEPSRRASRVAMKGQVATARNLSGGSAGNVRANTNQAYAEDFSRQDTINNNEVGRRMGITANNTDTLNKAQLINNQNNDNYDVLDLQNAAKKQEALSKGLEGISALSSRSILTSNQIAKENADRDMLSQAYRSYTLDENGKPVLKKAPVLRKGAKSIKMKKNC